MPESVDLSYFVGYSSERKCEDDIIDAIMRGEDLQEIILQMKKEAEEFKKLTLK